MKRLWSVLLLVVIVLVGGAVAQRTVDAQVLAAPPSGARLVIGAGMSNMSAGASVPGTEDLTEHPRVFAFYASHHDYVWSGTYPVFSNRYKLGGGIWRLAKDPVHLTQTAGVGPMLAMGKALADALPADTIGLIPCAHAGDDMTAWIPNGLALIPCLSRIREAQQGTGYATAIGMVFDGGGKDAQTSIAANAFESRLLGLIADVRAEIGDPCLPVVVHELPQGLSPTTYPYASTVNAALADIPNATSCAAFLTSIGKVTIGVHYDAASMHAWGQDDAAALLALQ